MQPQQERDFTRPEGLYLKFSDAGLPVNQNTPVIIERVNGDCSVSEFIIAREEAYKLPEQIKEFLGVSAQHAPFEETAFVAVERLLGRGCRPQACAPAYSSDWCDDCKAPQMVTGDGVHHCGEAPAPGADRLREALERCLSFMESIKLVEGEERDAHGVRWPSSRWKVDVKEQADAIKAVREVLAAAATAPDERDAIQERAYNNGFEHGRVAAGHASAERVRQLHGLVETLANSYKGVLPYDQFGNDTNLDADTRTRLALIADVLKKADALAVALPPSTGEKVSGATSPAKDGDAQ